MASSLQNKGSNPADQPNWEIFPPPPLPSYVPKQGEKYNFEKTIPPLPDSKVFDMAKCHIPGKHEVK